MYDVHESGRVLSSDFAARPPVSPLSAAELSLVLLGDGGGGGREGRVTAEARDFVRLQGVFNLLVSSDLIRRGNAGLAGLRNWRAFDNKRLYC